VGVAHPREFYFRGWVASTQAFFQAGLAHHGRAHPRATEKNKKS